MTRTNNLDIFVHWQTVKPAKDNPNPKAVKFPINLQQSLKNCSSVAYMAHEIDCKLSWSRLCVLLNECIKDKDQFSAEHDSYQIDHAQFKTNTAVFGVIDTGTGVKFGSSTSNKINKHLKPIQSDVDWAVAINAATVEYEPEPTEPSSSTTATKKRKKKHTAKRKIHTNRHPHDINHSIVAILVLHTNNDKNTSTKP